MELKSSEMWCSRRASASQRFEGSWRLHIESSNDLLDCLNLGDDAVTSLRTSPVVTPPGVRLRSDVRVVSLCHECFPSFLRAELRLDVRLVFLCDNMLLRSQNRSGGVMTRNIPGSYSPNDIRILFLDLLNLKDIWATWLFEMSGTIHAASRLRRHESSTLPLC